MRHEHTDLDIGSSGCRAQSQVATAKGQRCRRVAKSDRTNLIQSQVGASAIWSSSISHPDFQSWDRSAWAIEFIRAEDA